MRRRAPRPISTAIGEALERAEPETLLAAVQSVWAGAVGEAIARETTPVAERSGLITVACSTSAWAHELDLLGAQITAKVRSELPSVGGFEGLRFVVSADSPRSPI
jgi:predicted nucleic acid-binding Zn ribbon protein